MALSNYITTQPVAPPVQVGQPGAPAQPVPNPAAGTMPAPAMGTSPLASYFGMAQQTAPFPLEGRNYSQMLQESLSSFMNPQSTNIQQARQRGMELAATRGGVNSSIAAGAAERAALDQAVPLAQTATGMQAGLDQAQIQNWLSQQGFNREMAMAPFTSSMNMLARITDLGMQDPELYSPSVVSGFTNFFNQQMGDMLSRYFGAPSNG